MNALCRRVTAPWSMPLLLLLMLSLSPSAFATGQPASASAELDQALRVAESLSTAFEHAAETVSPAVVTVRSTVRIAGGRGQGMPSPFGDDSPFREFFGDDFFERFAPRTPRGPSGGFIRQGQGSGFIVSADGYIVTNNHVVDNATEVTIQLSEGAQYRAEIVGTDPSTDLALLKVDADDLPFVRLGDSDELGVGSWVVAVGNPFGLQSSITAGIVSATGRTRVGIADYEDFIQTDAAINPGNSGGPLVNLRGEVVGVNTAIATRTGGNMGIGFAIPSNLAVSIMEQLREKGAVTRGWLGVVIQDLNEGLARSFDYDGDAGVLVSQVEEDGPADQAGLQPGDIITRLEGEPLENIDQLRLEVADTQPGSVVELDVFREGRMRTIDVEIGSLDGETAVATEQPADADLGMQLRNLNPAIANQLGLDIERGVVIAAVQPLSAAARAGLARGQVITHVQDQRVANVREFQQALRRHDLSEGVRLTIRTATAQRFAFLRTPEGGD